MKGVLLIFTVLTVISYIACANAQIIRLTPEQYKEKTQKVWAKCKVDIQGITEDEYERVTTRPTIPTTKNEKCFKFCFGKGMGFLTSNGETIAREVKEGNRLTFAKDRVVIDLANKVFEDCDRELRIRRPPDSCEKAAIFTTCMMIGIHKAREQIPKHHAWMDEE